MRAYLLVFGSFFAGIAGGFLIPINVLGAAMALWIVFAGFLYFVDRLFDHLPSNDNWFLAVYALTYFGGSTFFVVGWLCTLIKYLFF